MAPKPPVPSPPPGTSCWALSRALRPLCVPALGTSLSPATTLHVTVKPNQGSTRSHQTYCCPQVIVILLPPHGDQRSPRDPLPFPTSSQLQDGVENPQNKEFSHRYANPGVTATVCCWERGVPSPAPADKSFLISLHPHARLHPCQNLSRSPGLPGRAGPWLTGLIGY